MTKAARGDHVWLDQAQAQFGGPPAGPLKAVFLDFEEVVSSISLWQYLGGSSATAAPKTQAASSNLAMKPCQRVALRHYPTKVLGVLGATAPLCAYAARAARTFVNPYHGYWNGADLEAEAEETQLA